MAASSSVGPMVGQAVVIQDPEQNRHGANGRFSPEVLELLQGAIASAEQARNKDVVAVLGYTGCGKSTLVNHLLGRTIVYNRETRKFGVAPGELEIAKIGQKLLGSETLYPTAYDPSAYNVDEIPYTLLDCGGLLDTRGVNTDIAIATSIKLALENAKSVRLLLCYESNAIFTNKCQDFIKFLNAILRSLVRNYADHADSIHLLFTKPHYISEGVMYTKENAMEDLYSIEEDIPGGALKNLFQFLLREDGKYISVHNPRSVESRITTLDAIKQLNEINQPQTAFKTFYAAQSTVLIVEALTRISVLGLELYQSYFRILEHSEREKRTLKHLAQQIECIAREVARMGGGENSPEIIREIGDRIRQQHLDMVAQQNTSIEENERLKTATLERIHQVVEKIEAWNIAGENSDLYWEDEINEKGVRYQPRTVTVTTHSRTWYGRRKTHTHSYTVHDPIHLVSTKDFQYRGPELETVVKTPAESPCWSLETLGADKKSYSVHYTSQSGVDAVANVKVYVKRKNKPSEVDIRAGLENDRQRETRELARLEEAMRGHVILKNIAQRNADSKGQDLDRIQEQSGTLEELREQAANHEVTLIDLENQKQTIKEQIVANQPEFSFFSDFLRLCGDHEIFNSECMIKFIDLASRYNGQNIR